MARPGWLAVLGLFTVLVVAGLILGVRVAWARSAATPHPVAAAPDPTSSRSVPAGFATPDPGDSAEPSAGGAGRSPGALPTTAAVLLVHVIGQVRHPGVVRLDPGARVKDAVKAAGGATGRANLGGLNLARPVADGEQISVPKPGDPPSPVAGAPPAGAPPADGSATGGVASGADDQVSGAPLDLNTASAEQLQALPGVGPVLSQRIIEWRTQHGRFSSVDELTEVSGIGDKKFAQLRDHVRV